MVKKTLCLALALCCLLALGGCGKRSGGSGAQLDIQQAAQDLVDEGPFQNQLIQATGDAVKSYYTLGDAVADHAIYIDGSGGSAEEVAVLEAVDEDSVDGVEAVARARVEELARRFQDYEPGQMKKIGDAVLVTRGRYVVLVICDDPAWAEDFVDRLF